MHEIVVWVPVGRLASWIDPGSGVISTVAAVDDRIEIDFEGNRIRAVNLRRYADRAFHAHGRQATRYPTSARMVAAIGSLLRVGTLDIEDGLVDLDDPLAVEGNRERLAQWLGLPDVPQEQLQVTGHRFETRRQLRAMLASGDPAEALKARWWAKRQRVQLPL